MTFLREFRNEAQYYHDYLHYAGFFAPHIIALKDGGFLSTILYQPKDFQKLSFEEIDYIVQQIQNAVDILDDGWTVHFDFHRKRVDSDRENSFTHALAREFEEEKKKQLVHKAHYNSLFFVNVFYKLPNKYNDWINVIFYDKYKENNSVQEALTFFTNKTEQFFQLITPAFDHASFLEDEELLTYLHSCTSLKYHKTVVPDIPFYLDAVLDDVEIDTQYPLCIDEQFINVVHVNDFPTFSRINMLSELQRIPFGFRYSSRFITFSRERTIKELQRYRAQFFSKRKGMMQTLQEQAGNEVLEKTDEIARANLVDDAMERVGNEEINFGLLTSKFIVYDKDFEELRNKTDILSKIMATHGFTCRVETFNAFDGFLATHPGNVYADVRRPLMQTKSLSHLIMASYPWQGERKNKHLEETFNDGQYHILGTTDGSSDFRFNLNVEDVGHTFIVGPTGAGKSILLLSLAIQFFRYKNAKVVIFDKDRSAFPLAKSLRGLTYVPGSKDSELRFQPLRDVDTQEGFLFALNFIKTVLELKNIAVTLHIEKEIARTLELFKEYDVDHRTISEYVLLLQDSDMHDTLQNALVFYTDKGPWGFLFDGNEQQIGEQTSENVNLRLFEMADIMRYKEDVVIPSLLYLFYVVERGLGKAPMLMIIDEAWLFLKHRIFAGQIEEWLKVLRKKHVYVVFATQEIADAVRSAISDTIITNCKTKIFLPNPAAANNDELYKKFGLAEKDINIIQSARQKHDYFYFSELGKRLFSLDLTPRQLEILKEGK